MMSRIFRNQVLHDLKKKVVFISGPRQVGKTTFAKSLFPFFQNPIYLNYDATEDRLIIDNKRWGSNVDLIIFDEIHKKKGWKNYLKGIFDTNTNKSSILVTASARLETFRKSGDSMTGRFFSLRMMPFSVKQLLDEGLTASMEDLFDKSGFPEPFFTESEIDRNRWRNQYIDTVVREDVLDLERINEFKSLQHLIELLRRRVGSPVSYRSLSEDLHISPNTVKRYIDILESLYIIFRITPFSKKIQRSLQREPKVYFFDWNLAEGDGAKLENFVAVHLLKHTLASNDFFGKQLELGYLRTKDGKELDFCLSEKDKLIEAFEVKTSELDASKNALWFHNKFNFPITQLVRYAKLESVVKGVKIIPLERALAKFFM